MEEYQNHADTQTISGPFAAVLSAKNEDRLKEYARRLLQFTERETKASATDIALHCRHAGNRWKTDLLL
ncbi:hypothetical protein QNN00_21055 [Bacillus velezensis]|nr:hypothetical protein [Bacillus velezensis]